MDEASYDELLGAFLRTFLPANLDRHYRLIAELSYPIPDMRSFRQQLAAVDASEHDVDRLSSLMEPEDFGLDTVQSALEKFHRRSRHLAVPGVPLAPPKARLLADMVSSGGLSISDADEVSLRIMGGAAGQPTANVKCLCAGGGEGSCQIQVYGDTLRCLKGSCEGTCDLLVKFPAAYSGGITIA